MPYQCYSEVVPQDSYVLLLLRNPKVPRGRGRYLGIKDPPSPQLYSAQSEYPYLVSEVRRFLTPKLALPKL